ncbi:hypothetical protein BJF79_06330 [Actinomadura sp. CNU-125]|uniref:DUF6939 family protein n=1 Tax=Actinomadura sp. CNU-125 TaxID=1904961 RepID=UPI00096852C6|nr:hypothetical protein [Actinomadura sp. CNU-125]OLT36986.1 hypothetical protein BJF79_06330 [Actinomadura sp. CNU-125]
MAPWVAGRRRGAKSLEAEFPGAVILDVTSKGPEPWVRFSPFWPHGGVPVPGMPGVFSESVEGVWQGLKVFEGADADPGRFRITSMRGIKRTVRKYGPVLGHRLGDELVPYERARREIYLPTYRWVLEHRLGALVERLRGMGDVVLLDYTVNGDVGELRVPLSHAQLVRSWVSSGVVGR